MKDIIKIIGQRITKIRKQKNISEKRLSKMSNLSVLSLRQIEQGLGDPPVYTLYKIAKGLDITIDKILEDI